LIYEFTLERHVLDTHLLGSIDCFVDLSDVRNHLKPFRCVPARSTPSNSAKDRSMPNFGFHIRHGNHSSDHNVDLPDVRAAHKEATMIFGDMARDVAAQLNETPEWRMDVSDESGKSLFRLRLLTEPLEQAVLACFDP
jgi:hypothetical protein